MLTRNFPTLFRDRNVKSNSFSDLMDEMFDEMANVNRNRFVPSMDVAETDKEFEVTLALPGLNKEDIDIEIENDVLTVSGERRWEHEEKENGREYHRVESGRGQTVNMLRQNSTTVNFKSQYQSSRKKQLRK